MRHFDSHAYRTEDEAGVWDFAAGSMRTYLILKDKVARFNADSAIQALLGDLRGRDYDVVYLGYNADGRIGRFNITASFYAALGEDRNSFFTDRPADTAIETSADPAEYPRAPPAEITAGAYERK